jgi:putative Mg2+ transporter-C (MgtC) family protein
MQTPPHTPLMLSSSVARLGVAALLGATVGLERTIHRKTAGLRTSMFICVGAAMFTILGDLMATPVGGDPTRIGANIVQGVGFLGAGTILQNKAGVVGLTTAAVIWVVASIGMACGAGHFTLAAFTTLLTLFALNVLGYAETALGFKTVTRGYEVKGKSSPELLDLLNDILEERRHFMHGLQVGRSQGVSRVVFSVTCALPEQEQLFQALKRRSEFEEVRTFSAALEE